MSPDHRRVRGRIPRFPRVSGDEPVYVDSLDIALPFSPRERG